MDANGPAGIARNARAAFVMRLPILYPIALFAAWIVAWFIDAGIRGATNWSTNADTAYWIAMKLWLWLGPLPWLIRRDQDAPAAGDAQCVADYIALREPRSGAVNGLWIGALLLLFSFAMDSFLGGAAFLIPLLDLSLVNAILVAPVVEELTMRGFYLSALLKRGMPFANANLAAGIFFVAMHLPGWYFEG